MLKRRAVVSIGLFLLSLALCSVLCVPAHADDSIVITSTFVNDFRGCGKPMVVAVKQVTPWALVTFTQNDETGKVWEGVGLMKKAGSKWKIVDDTGAGPTTEFLKRNKVPAVLWTPLLGAAEIERARPVLEFLRRKNKDGYYINVRTAGNWALASWTDNESGGQSLLKKTGTTWKVVGGGGGAMDANSLKKAGVPANLVNSLLGIR